MVIRYWLIVIRSRPISSYWLIDTRYWLRKSLTFNALENIITAFI